MLHLIHAAEHSEYARFATHPTERPACDGVIGTQFLEAVDMSLGHLAQCATTERLHDDGLDIVLCQLVVEVLGISVTPSFFSQRGMAPVEEVHLYLHEVPVILIIMLDEPVKDLDIAVIGESQVTDSPSLALLEQEVEHTVIQKARTEVLHTLATHTMEQIVIDVVNLQLLERVVIHLLRLLQRPVLLAIVRHLGGDIVAVARVPAQRHPDNSLVLAASINGRSVKVVHAMRQGVVHQLVDQFLVVARQSHHAEAQQRDALARAVLDTVGHLVVGHGSCLRLVILRQCLQRVQRHHGGA